MMREQMFAEQNLLLLRAPGGPLVTSACICISAFALIIDSTKKGHDQIGGASGVLL